MSAANLFRNSFNGARLERANLAGAYAVGAIFVGANLRGANLRDADLRCADFSGADLTGADLRGAKLDSAVMHRAVLDEADVRFAKGLLVDENSVYRTKFTNRGGMVWQLLALALGALDWLTVKFGSRHAADRTPAYEREDQWSTFRRIYTGPNFFISLLFLVSFTLPYIGKALILAEVSRTEAAAMRSLARLTGQEWAQLETAASESGTLEQRLPQEYEAIRAGFDRALTTARQAVTAIAESSPVPDVDEAREALKVISGELQSLEARMDRMRKEIPVWFIASAKAREYAVWQILLGIDTGQFVWTALICLLIVYNGAKWILTTNVAPMRDAEDRSRITPARVEYQTLLPLHYVVSILFWLSTAAAVYTAANLMIEPVYKFW